MIDLRSTAGCNERVAAGSGDARYVAAAPMRKAFAFAPAFIAVLVLPANAQEPFRHHQDHVLGTSLDLAVAAPDAVAGQFRDAVLAEIGRLDAILSGWRSDSPVAQLSRGETVKAAPAELLLVLDLADTWRIRSSGAFDVRIGTVAATWRTAAAAGKPPTEQQLAAALTAMRASGYAIDRNAGTVTPNGPLALAVDGVAKGVVLDHALAAARSACPEVAGALLDIGGDAVAFGAAPGGRPWRVGIANPLHPADNAPLLAELDLDAGAHGNRAIATSGGYARGYRIGDELRSHILDPGTGQPAQTASATVIANDAALADVLATTLCVLGAKDGLELAASYQNVECLIVDADGRHHGSAGFATMVATPIDAASSAFPAGYQLEIAVTLPKIEGRRYERPYVAVWIENAAGQHLRSLTLWGRERRWVHELTKWWRAMDGDEGLVDTISRASRGPGEYRVTWDGRDALGLPVPNGTYTVAIEVAREHGGHTTSRAAIACAATPAAAAIPANGELAGAQLHYGGASAGTEHGGK